MAEGKDQKAFNEVTTRRYADQAMFFLNAFWPEMGDKAEQVWGYWQKFVELDKLQWGALPEGKRDEEWKEGSSLDEFWSHKYLESFGKVLTALKFREEFKKIDVNFDKRMALVEFCLWDFKQTVEELMKRPQGTNEELVKAQAALREVQAEIKKIEDKKTKLEAAMQAGGVKGSSAKNELEQLLSADPTDLNRAVLTAEAAVRKAQKMKGEQPQGALWWVDRELQEAKKYKPRGKK